MDLLGCVTARHLAIAVPFVFACAGGLARAARPLRSISVGAALALALAAVHAAAVAFAPSGPRTMLSPFVRTDAIAAVALLLVAGLAVVVARYSRAYLAGERGLLRYERALGAAIAGASLVIVSNHLVVLAIAWTATSLALHVLLTFYRERPRAVAAAHKKFLLARLADVFTFAAVLILGRVTGTLEIDRVAEWIIASPALPTSLQVAATLLAAAVCLRSAQLPFHGWLLEVMEAPTPVSALLHAGIVNIGGIVLLRLAPLITMAPFARDLLVVIGTTSAVVGALVMTTRSTIKTSLAWSTSAQMGFMLVECGLGAWHLALLHMVAHSTYKAHAFLSSGHAVDRWKLARLAGTPAARPSTPKLVVTIASACAGAVALAMFGETEAAFVVLSFVPACVRAFALPRRALLSVATRLAALGALYLLVWPAVFAELARADPPAAFGVVFAGCGLLALVATQTTLELWPASSGARWIHRWLRAELYLDDLFTAFAFRVWPIRPASGTRAASLQKVEA